MATDWSHIVEILSAVSHGSPHVAVQELCKVISNRLVFISPCSFVCL